MTTASKMWWRCTECDVSWHSEEPGMCWLCETGACVERGTSPSATAYCAMSVRWPDG